MDYNSYLSCLSTIGYNPSSSGNGPTNDNGYYTVGFSSNTANPPTGTNWAIEFPDCDTKQNGPGHSIFEAGKGTGGKKSSISWITGSTSSTGISAPSGQSLLSPNFFQAVAVGVIDSNKKDQNTADRWTMTSQKKLINSTVGY